MRGVLKAYTNSRIGPPPTPLTPLRKCKRVVTKTLPCQRCLRAIRDNPDEVLVYEKPTGYSWYNRYTTTNRGGERDYYPVSIGYLLRVLY